MSASTNMKDKESPIPIENTNKLSNFTCPKCQSSFYTVADICNHIQQCYFQLRCTKCDADTYATESDLIDHYVTNHHNDHVGGDATEMSCPLCNKSDLTNCDSLLNHLRVIHASGDGKGGGANHGHMKRKLPKVGDRVIAMWSELKWEYFAATVSSFNEDTMKYQVDWAHGDTEGRSIDIADIALDQIPEDDELGAGTLVLFRQGTYDAGWKHWKHWRGGRRWHQGIITGVQRGPNGYKTYSGHHTKSGVDEKFDKYKSFSHEFHNLTKYDFRLAPNIFDVLHFVEKTADTQDLDIYLSYDLIDSYQAVTNNEVEDDKIPNSYKKLGYDKMCDPADIETFLRKQGFKVSKQSRSGEQDIRQVASMIKHTKVFIACLSDSYVINNQCTMEFKYAKLSLKKPVIPLVVGDGSFQWVASLLGMLIAGELFIHFRDKEVEEDKNEEMLTNIRKHIPEEKREDQGTSEDKVEGKVKRGPPDVFLSYCWSNSHNALDAKQIQTVHGNRFSDPRLLKEKISAHGYNVWLDIEQLHSANADAGLFGQIVQGLKGAKLVVPCVSDEYAKSQNCTMEFQFSLKSLSKPVVTIVVGSGEEWRGSVVGALLSTSDKEPINLQEITDESELDEKVTQVVRNIETIIGRPRKRGSVKDKTRRRITSCDESDDDDSSDVSSSESSTDSSNEGSENEALLPLLSNLEPSPLRLRAPRIEDRVVGHYKNSTYYIATVVGVNARSMTYTIEWEDEEFSACVQPFDEVALDKAPERDDIGIGTLILFPQGTYACHVCGSQHARYFEGEITMIAEIAENAESGNVTVSGHHTKPGMGWIFNSVGYCYNFERITLEEIRVAPTAFDFLEMCVDEEQREEKPDPAVRRYYST